MAEIATLQGRAGGYKTASATMAYQDIIFEKKGEAAWITINREQDGNTFRTRTLDEMLDALEIARRDAGYRTVVITGSGQRFFCLGGDHGAGHDDDAHADADAALHYGRMFPVSDLYDAIDRHPKPVIACVNGYAVGGGNVLAMMCDLTLASKDAQFRQVGPIMGSFDAGFGTWYLEEAVGRKKAKEIWFLNRKYSAAEALDMGLVNEVVEPERLQVRCEELCDQLAERGPQALAALKAAFHARHAGAAGLSRVTTDLLTLSYYQSEESKELGRAFAAKQSPDKKKFYR
ncbi:MAG: enoyl-CoA hydratase-related protein [Deltaproteobacteria bacterium]